MTRLLKTLAALMHEVMGTFPNTTALRSASPGALGMVALKGLARYLRGGGTMTARGLVDDIVNGIDGTKEGKRVAAEAVAWLDRSGLIAALEDTVGSGFLFVTRLGDEVLEADSDAAGGVALAARAIDLVPEKIRAKVIQPLLAGDFDLAITAACKAVETTMRERAQLPTSDFGSRLARKFFQNVDSTALQHAERHGDLSDEERLFEGLFGLYRDRAVHDVPHVDDPVVALEIITIAGHLLRIVESANIRAGAV